MTVEKCCVKWLPLLFKVIIIIILLLLFFLTRGNGETGEEGQLRLYSPAVEESFCTNPGKAHLHIHIIIFPTVRCILIRFSRLSEYSFFTPGSKLHSPEKRLRIHFTVCCTFRTINVTDKVLWILNLSVLGMETVMLQHTHSIQLSAS